MTHFTSQDNAARILDQLRREVLVQSRSDSDLGAKEVSLRLYSRYGLNDPSEHVHSPRQAGIGHCRQRESQSEINRLVFPDTAFIHCGSRETESEDTDRLDLWRAYGANGEGIAITTIWSRRGLSGNGLSVLEVEYVLSDQLEKNKERANELQEEIDKAIEANDTDRASKLQKRRMKLEVGYKPSDYESESEIRIIYFAGDQSNVVPNTLRYSVEGGRLRTYVERKVTIGVGQALSGLYVTIGPRVSEHEARHWEIMADWTMRQLGLSGSRQTCQSKLAYIA